MLTKNNKTKYTSKIKVLKILNKTKKDKYLRNGGYYANGSFK